MAHPPASPGLRRGLILFFTFIILLGIGILWGSVGRLAVRDYRVATAYREAQCRILDLRLETFSSKSKSKTGSRTRTRRTTSTIPIFTFRFEVDGKPVTTTGYDSYGGRDAESADYSRFDVGKTYPCWYDPADPTQAVLVKEWVPSRYWVALIPLGMIFLAGIFLRGITGGPAPTVTESANPPSSRPQSSRRIPWLPIAIGTGIAGLLVLTVVLPIIAQQKVRAQYPAIGAARSDGPEILQALGRPPETEANGFRSTEEGPKRRSLANAGTAWLAWTHPHESALGFDKVTAWYVDKLTAESWAVHRAADANGAEFCKAPWLMRITRTKEVGTGCHYDVRLEWNNQFAAGKCNHP